MLSPTSQRGAGQQTLYNRRYNNNIKKGNIKGPKSSNKSLKILMDNHSSGKKKIITQNNNQRYNEDDKFFNEMGSSVDLTDKNDRNN